MALTLNEEQRLLQDTAREFLAQHAPVSALRQLRDSRDSLGYSPELWRKMAELGWAGIILPEQYGGLDFGFPGLGALLEETGRTLAASPLLASAVIGASAILLGGSEEQKNEHLPAIAKGDFTTALALEEGPHHNPAGTALVAKKTGGRYRLRGRKVFVADGHSADLLIVPARTRGEPGDSEGISLFLVASGSPGLRRQRTLMADSRNAANLYFEDVALPAHCLLGEAHRGWRILEPVLNRARIALAAEMLGSAREVIERTLNYLREREQFGVKIGTFQALQHRAALLYIRLEMAQSVVMQALSTVDESASVDESKAALADRTAPQLPLLASLAKSTLNDLALDATNEAVQMHGGIGVTDELDIGLFLKRARVAIQLFGDSGFHKDRYATLRGY